MIAWARHNASTAGSAPLDGIPWKRLRRWFGPLPRRREAHAMSWMALAVGIAFCALSLFRGFQGEAFMGRPLGGDFVEFYEAGKILNDYEPWRLYDLQLAVALQHATVPTMEKTQMLVFAHAPYVAFLFRPFALLPYAWAYSAWLAFSAALYFGSLLLVFRSVNLSKEDVKTGLLLAMSAVPFMLETWIGGQISVLVCFAWALFVYCRGKNQIFLAGAALSLCLFKPTLLALPVVMLIFGRCWRTLAGMAAGAAALALTCIGMVGLRGCHAWIDTLLFYARMTEKSGEGWRLVKYVDIASFSHLLLGNAPLASAILFGSIAVLVIIRLAAAWWRTGVNAMQPAASLLWAGTICFTLVVNAYSPVYDTALLAVAVILAAGELNRSTEDFEIFTAWLLLLYLVPWITQSFAEYLHIQLFTVILLGFGAWALRMANRISIAPSCSALNESIRPLAEFLTPAPQCISGPISNKVL